MKLTFIITIDPVKGLPLLNILIHSLNLQTSKNFDVVFYNQTLLSRKEIFATLSVEPVFEYQFFSIEKKDFFGKYPIWDLFSFHSFLLDEDLLSDYLMCIHMEEFFDADYVEKVTSVLERSGLDILLGNLCRTEVNYDGIREILNCKTVAEFEAYQKCSGLKASNHWVFKPYSGSYRRRWDTFKKNYPKYLDFRFSNRLRPNRKGYTKMKKYEDLYLMKKEFAKRHNWFLQGHEMYFEDIQLCNKKGVCELTKELNKLTDYPNYFNQSKVYHIQHEKYYYQLQDEQFTKLFLRSKTDDILLNTLKKAIKLYQSGEMNLHQALIYSRRNSELAGTQNLNYKYHMQYLNRKVAAALT